jgi:hypothetical protein
MVLLLSYSLCDEIMHMFATLNVSLLEKRFIITPEIHYWYRLVTIADTTNSGLTSRYQKSIIGIG